MTAETVALNIRPKMSTDFRAGAMVTADFMLPNPGSEAESMDVRFPLGYPALRAGLIPPSFEAQDLRARVGKAGATTQTVTFAVHPRRSGRGSSRPQRMSAS